MKNKLFWVLALGMMLGILCVTVRVIMPLVVLVTLICVIGLLLRKLFK
jgi:hypothetical protein